MNNKLIVIVGPTSSNKSDLALLLSDLYKSPIINADAYQVYSELNCGTNKLPLDIINNKPIYLMNHLSIYDEWNINVFQKQAKSLITDFANKNLIPIIVGGSNLYVDALIKGYQLDNIAKRDDSYEQYTNLKLYTMLFDIDQLEAIKITVGNKKRLIRALQIIDQTKQLKSIKDLQKDYVYDCFVIYCQVERQQLYQKINARVNQMINSGWLNEVSLLLKKDPNVMNLNALKAIGYQEVYEALINHQPINNELIAQKTRRYAKRQITWCNHKYPNCFVYDQNNKQQLLSQLKKFINHD